MYAATVAFVACVMNESATKVTVVVVEAVAGLCVPVCAVYPYLATFQDHVPVCPVVSRV